MNALNNTLKEIQHTLQEHSQRLNYVEDAAYHWAMDNDTCSENNLKPDSTQEPEIKYTDNDFNFSWDPPPSHLATALQQGPFKSRKRRAEGSPAIDTRTLQSQVSQIGSLLTDFSSNLESLQQQQLPAQTNEQQPQSHYESQTCNDAGNSNTTNQDT